MSRALVFSFFVVVVVLALGQLALALAVGDDGVDRPGNDLPNMPIVLNATDGPETCQALCRLNPNCFAWVYGKNEAPCSGSKLCWLKNPVPTQSPNQCRISGVKGARLGFPEYLPLPAGQIKPTGWLKQQLLLQAKGLATYLAYFWPDVSDSVWIGGKTQDPGNLNERVPYWLNGMVPLAILLNDTKDGQVVMKLVDKYLHYIVTHQAEDGWLGPDCCDPWPRYPLLLAMMQYMEGRPEMVGTFLPAVMKFFYRLRAELDKNPLSSWAQYRWQDLVLAIYWVYDNHPELGQQQFLLDLAELVYEQGFRWDDFFAGNQFPKVACLAGCQSLATHGVNNGQALKSSAVWYRQSQSEWDRISTMQRVETIDKYHGQATGMFSCSEHLAGLDPSQGTELCTVVETMYSFEVMFSVFGHIPHADRIEYLAFNALPAAITPDMWAHVYLQQVNQINAQECDPNIYVSDGPQSNIYGLEPNYGCCTVNYPQGWPKFVTNLYMRTKDGYGLAVVAYAPSTLRTVLQRKPIEISLDTNYPFDERLNFTIRSSVSFPFYLRIPSWADGATVHVVESIQAEKENDIKKDNFKIIEAKPGTMQKVIIGAGTTLVKLVLPMTFRLVQRPNGAISIYRGPLLYSLKMDEHWTELQHHAFNSSDWQIEPLNQWPYALDVDLLHPNRTLTFVPMKGHSVGPLPFSPNGSPVKAVAQGRLIANSWKEESNAAAPPPPSPLSATSPKQNLTLIPYGATDLRIAEFPRLSK